MYENFEGEPTPPLRAILWRPQFYSTKNLCDTTMIETFSDHSATHHGATLLPNCSAALRHGVSVEEETSNYDLTSDEAGKCVRIARIALAFFLWINQTIIVAEPEQIERHARKRLDRLAPPDFNRTIRVVRLRRTRRTTQTEEHAGIEWTCQWVVSGHWRNQYHPSTQRHEPRWILPYVKGPEDKPLKPPSERVFAVVR